MVSDEAALLSPEVATGRESLPLDLCLAIHRIMVRARVMEERMIKMSKSGQAYFWIGGPGEEAFNAVLGLLVKKGEGPLFDYLHLHYRNSACLVAMGMPLADALRQMAMTVTDPHSLGRNFAGHFAVKAWNVVPVTSVIEVQYAMAPGTALMQKRAGGDGVTVVVGGEAGTAEGDFATCLVWSTLPGREVPVLIAVTNNGWGISTNAGTVHSERRIIDRGKPHGIPGEIVDGNDPVASWHAVSRALGHCRLTRKPFMLEALVSRLYGHSSSSGAFRDKDQLCPIELFEKRLLEAGVDQVVLDAVHADAQAEVEASVEKVLSEPMPTVDDIPRFTYAPSEVDAVYPDDYTGLPR